MRILRILGTLSFVPLVLSFVPSFFDPLYASYFLARDLGIQGHIDNSHNHNHGKEVLFWAQEIIKGLDHKLIKNDLLMIGQCCILHDLLDHKYTDFSDQVETHLDLYHKIHEKEIMMKIMQDMSYSKTVRHNKLITPDWLEESPFEEVYHIVREADLLSSFNLARMIEYRRRKSPHLSDNEGIQECINLWDKRMNRLIENQVFVHPPALSLADSLTKVARLKMRILPTVYPSPNLDLLRIINYLSIYDLVKEFESIPCVYH